jgi:hypothetical protein
METTTTHSKLRQSGSAMLRDIRQRLAMAKRQRTSTLVEDCEAFLAGRAGDVLTSVRGTFPPWTWVNLLAHANLSGLGELASRDPKSRPFDSNGPWARATSFVAAELLAAARNDPQTLRHIQFEVLIPIELELLSGQEALLSPQQLVRRVWRGLSGGRDFGPAANPRASTQVEPVPVDRGEELFYRSNRERSGSDE